MIIAVGSTNQVKIQAVVEVIQDYPELAAAKVMAFSVSSDVSDQPLTFEEIIRGAKNRAKNAYAACNECSYSFGIESGLFEAVGTQTGYLEACICAIYTGENFHVGLSCGFEIPPKILDLVIDKKMDLSTACYTSQVTSNPKLGAAEGLVGILSKGRITRKEYTKQCVITALAQVDHAEWYAQTDFVT
jgi:inosine/xanthosine triphosphatase